MHLCSGGADHVCAAAHIAGGGKDNQIYLGAFLDFLLIIANVGTAVVLYRVARR